MNKIIFIFVLSTSFAVHTEKPSMIERLRAGAAYFDRGQYREALSALGKIDVKNDLDNADDMKLALKIRSIAFDKLGDQEQSKQNLRELFLLDPDYQLSPFDTPQSLVDLAAQEKALINEKNQHLAAIKHEVEKAQSESKVQPLELAAPVPERKTSWPVTLMPLGLNHFYQDSNFKGGIYFSLQSLALATNIAAYWWKSSYLNNFGSQHLQDLKNKGRFETAQMIQYIGLGALLVGYAVSVVDALINF